MLTPLSGRNLVKNLSQSEGYLIIYITKKGIRQEVDLSPNGKKCPEFGECFIRAVMALSFYQQKFRRLISQINKAQKQKEM